MAVLLSVLMLPLSLRIHEKETGAITTTLSNTQCHSLDSCKAALQLSLEERNVCVQKCKALVAGITQNQLNIISRLYRLGAFRIWYGQPLRLPWWWGLLGGLLEEITLVSRAEY
jgi:hypothetical protein